MTKGFYDVDHYDIDTDIASDKISAIRHSLWGHELEEAESAISELAVTISECYNYKDVVYILSRDKSVSVDGLLEDNPLAEEIKNIDLESIAKHICGECYDITSFETEICDIHYDQSGRLSSFTKRHKPIWYGYLIAAANYVDELKLPGYKLIKRFKRV